eukprot:CAMPEP_0197448558 /NCGR_PEP_ID=MMETSP1175-20131217/18055_1 /TAXON_ID=1003142 /ORGANISM="Triceratium dubium, Strain CCMP147" /LENGTH=427 /DNA_ID=CAMNT_0042980359 /DNA_START=220 /DNA_END=1503 /DNA_ORIENTATION=+
MSKKGGSDSDLPKGEVTFASPAKGDDGTPHAECWSAGDACNPSIDGPSSSGDGTVSPRQDFEKNGSVPAHAPTRPSSGGEGRTSNESVHQGSTGTPDAYDETGIYLAPHAPTISTLSSKSVNSRHRQRIHDHILRQHAQSMSKMSYNQFNDVGELIQGPSNSSPPQVASGTIVGQVSTVIPPSTGFNDEEDDTLPKKSIFRDWRVTALIFVLLVSAVGLGTYFIASRFFGSKSENQLTAGTDDPSTPSIGTEEERPSQEKNFLFVFMNPFTMDLVADSPNLISEDLLSTVVQAWLGFFMASISDFHSLELDAVMILPEGHRILAENQSMQSDPAIISAQFDGIVKMSADLTENVELNTIQALLQAALGRAFSALNIDMFLKELRENELQVSAVAVFDMWGNELGSSGSFGVLSDFESNDINTTTEQP